MEEDKTPLDELLELALQNESVQEQCIPCKNSTKSAASKHVLRDCPLPLFGENVDSKTENRIVDEPSVVHSGNLDVSDDEDDYSENRVYNSYGKELKALLSQTNHTTTEKDSALSWKSKIDKSSLCDSWYCDPFFGIRITKPLISSTSLKEKMCGKKPVSLSVIKNYVRNPDIQEDWVAAGVVVQKGAPKISQKGSQYCIWTLSDLKDELHTITLFLFSGAYKQLWKTAVGTVIGILSPSVMNSDLKNSQACLSVSNANRVMIFGQSKDLGFCKSKKKNGEPCTAFVNTNRCTFCIYHVKQEYQKCSNRSELQSSFGGRGLVALRNKVLGKNEVFYAGKSYTAIPAKKSNKQTMRDNKILGALNGEAQSLKSIFKNSKVASSLDLSNNQRLKDLKRLQLLGDSDCGSVQTNGNTGMNVINFQQPITKSSDNSVTASFSDNKRFINCSTVSISDTGKLSTPEKAPVLSPCASGFVDLNSKIPQRRTNMAKLNALKWVRENGPIKKTDPKNIKGAKRPSKPSLDDVPSKKSKINVFSDEYKKLIETNSKHVNLLENYDNEEEEKYFKKLELKESLEDKMSSTYKINCKAVRCLVCKYTSFSASDFCKAERHSLKVMDATKRFFKCGDCGCRTVTLDIIPSHTCKQCNSSKWERTTMMKEKKVHIMESLSIRGGEQTFLGSSVTDANINLLVPDE